MMSVVVILVLLETVRFLIKDKSETLSSKYVCRTKPTPQNYKIFCSGQHSRGYCPANFQKQPVINTIAEYGHEIEMYTVEQGEKRDKRQ